MPYIEPARRRHVAPKPPCRAQTPGELNFQVASLVEGYIDAHGLSYATVNDVIGSLECCKLEVYRRLAAPYEDTKIEANGEVFSAALREEQE